MNLILCVSMILFVFGSECIGPVESLMCYKCGHSYGQSPDNCSTVTQFTPTTHCTKQEECVTVVNFDLRLQFIKGVYRMCKELLKASCTHDTCYDKCKNDKCNNRIITLVCDMAKCKNGATCNENNGDYTCTCVKGYTGRNCETNIDECSSSPCKNSGTCTDEVNGYNCECDSKYVGKHCEIRGVYCYTCSYVWTADTTNTRECVDDPDKVKTGAPSIPCPHPRYCTIIRRFDFNLPNKKAPGGKGDIRSYTRMCDTVNRGNYCVNETNFGRQTCYSTCQHSSCNSVDGNTDPVSMAMGNMSVNGLNWKELFDYNADLSGSKTEQASYVLVALVTSIALLSVSQ